MAITGESSCRASRAERRDVQVDAVLGRGHAARVGPVERDDLQVVDRDQAAVRADPRHLRGGLLADRIDGGRVVARDDRQVAADVEVFPHRLLEPEDVLGVVAAAGGPGRCAGC